MLSQEEVKRLFDYADGCLMWRVRPSNRVVIGSVVGTVDSRGYRRVRVKSKAYLVHRLVFLWHYGFMPSVVDHVDGNTTNNAIENLREATQQQNCCNAKAPKHNSSGVKGVHWHARAAKWQARVMVAKRTISLGLYEDLELAALVAAEGRAKYHGAFARM